MTKKEIIEIINRILTEEGFGFEKDFDEEKTLEDIGMDSLDSLNFIADCEKKFSIEIEDAAILTTSSLQSIIDTIYNIKN